MDIIICKSTVVQIVQATEKAKKVSALLALSKKILITKGQQFPCRDAIM